MLETLGGGISGGSGGIDAGAGPATSGSPNSQGNVSFGGIGSRVEKTDTTGIGIALVVVVILMLGAFLYANKR